MSLNMTHDRPQRSTHGGRDQLRSGDRFRIQRSHVVTWLALAVALFFAGVALGESDSAGAAEADGVLFGAYAQPRSGQSDIAAVQALEASLGSELPIVRAGNYVVIGRSSGQRVDLSCVRA